jgi:hypothetical protein
MRRASRYRRRAAHRREVPDAAREQSLVADQESALDRDAARLLQTAYLRLNRARTRVEKAFRSLAKNGR